MSLWIICPGLKAKRQHNQIFDAPYIDTLTLVWLTLGNQGESLYQCILL